MQINKDRIKLLNGDAAIVLGDPIYIDNDPSLSALMRAIVIESGERDAEQIKIKSSVNRMIVEGDAGVETALSQEYGIIILETKNSYFPENYTSEGWKSLDAPPFPVNKYLSQFTRTKVLINEELKRVIAIVERRASRRWLQAFMSVLPRTMTWYFPLDLTPECKALYTAISVGNDKISEAEAVNIFAEYVNSVADTIDFRSAALHKVLDQHADRLRKVQIDSARSAIDGHLSNIRLHKDSLVDLYRKLEDNQIMLKALMSLSEANNSRLYDFFDTHKQLTVLSTGDDSIRFGIAETLEYYDEDEFIALMEEKNSYIYESDYIDDDIILLLNAIFGERRGVFYTNSVFSLTSMRYVNVCEDESFVYDALPHPHLYFYGCTGANDQYFDQYAESGDWDLGIEQAIAATKNLNFGDSTVVNRMIEWIACNRDRKCIYAESDRSRLYSISEFINKIKEGES